MWWIVAIIAGIYILGKQQLKNVAQPNVVSNSQVGAGVSAIAGNNNANVNPSIPKPTMETPVFYQESNSATKETPITTQAITRIVSPIRATGEAVDTPLVSPTQEHSNIIISDRLRVNYERFTPRGLNPIDTRDYGINDGETYSAEINRPGTSPINRLSGTAKLAVNPLVPIRSVTTVPSKPPVNTIAPHTLAPTNRLSGTGSTTLESTAQRIAEQIPNYAMLPANVREAIATNLKTAYL